MTYMLDADPGGPGDGFGPSGLPAAARTLVGTAAFLGGADVLKRIPETPIEVHRLIAGGLPVVTVEILRKALGRFGTDDAFAPLVGVTARTLQRWRQDPAAVLSVDQSGRVWTFAGLLSRATDVFGSIPAAEAWLDAPAMALDGLRPVDLLETPAGAALVADHLTRLDYGVYV